MKTSKNLDQIEQIIRRLSSLEDAREELRIKDMPTHHEDAELRELRILLGQLMNSSYGGNRDVYQR